jgi:hypothetical protein
LSSVRCGKDLIFWTAAAADAAAALGVARRMSHRATSAQSATCCLAQSNTLSSSCKDGVAFHLCLSAGMTRLK